MNTTDFTQSDVSIHHQQQHVRGYLLHRSAIFQRLGLPQFRRDSEHLLEVTDWAKTPKYIFISHRYLSLENADDQLFTKYKVITALLRQMKNVEYIWCDFCCLPADEVEKGASSLLLKSMFDAITKAVRVLLIPFRSIGQTKPPVFDLQEYSNRAWCVLEYSTIMACHPSRIRIARIVQQPCGGTYKLEFLSLPTHDKSLGIDLLIRNLQRARALLEAGDQGAFLHTFRAATAIHAETVWDLLNARKGQIFTAVGQRRNSDFFVRTRFASQRANVPGQQLDLYEPAVLESMDFRCLLEGPLGVFTGWFGRRDLLSGW